ncbi:hypothetical protein BH759_05710 [Ralstonia solanacearum]|nr:hypothetical protein BH759_05710 [Ralstonia solanacearum]
MPVVNIPNSKNRLNYNAVAMDLERQGIEPFFLIFWLQGLKEETFWRFAEGTPVYWQYTPEQREYLEQTALLADYQERIPELYKLRDDVTQTGRYSGWDQTFHDHEVEFCAVMDQALSWIRDHAHHLIALHQMDAPHLDTTKWICLEWLQYQFRHNVRDIQSLSDSAQEAGDSGSSEPQQSQDSNSKNKPAPAAEDTTPTP